MNKLSKEKRERLILVLLGAFLLGVGLWYGVLEGSLGTLKANRIRVTELEEVLRTARRQEALAAKLQSDVQQAQKKIKGLEARMTAGDPYRWLSRAFLDLPRSTDVKILSLEPPRVEELNIWPRLPYRGAAFAMSGTAYYQDFGSFLAGIENAFPHMRLRSLELKPASLGDVMAEESEKLEFRMNLLTLVSTNAPAQEHESPAAPLSAKH